MSEMKKKLFRGKIKSVDTANKTVDAIISTDSVDRYNEIILKSAWKDGLKDFKAHPVLLSSHSYGSLQNQIGELRNLRVTDEGLTATIKYYAGEGNPEADWGFKLAEKGMAAFSVGFQPKAYVTKYDDDDAIKSILDENGIKLKKGVKVDVVYTKVALLENSQVTVPANQDALQKSFEGFDKDTIIKEMGESILEMEAELESDEESEKSAEETMEEIIGERDNEGKKKEADGDGDGDGDANLDDDIGDNGCGCDDVCDNCITKITEEITAEVMKGITEGLVVEAVEAIKTEIEKGFDERFEKFYKLTLSLYNVSEMRQLDKDLDNIKKDLDEDGDEVDTNAIYKAILNARKKEVSE